MVTLARYNIGCAAMPLCAFCAGRRWLLEEGYGKKEAFGCRKKVKRAVHGHRRRRVFRAGRAERCAAGGGGNGPGALWACRSVARAGRRSALCAAAGLFLVRPAPGARGEGRATDPLTDIARYTDRAVPLWRAARVLGGNDRRKRLPRAVRARLWRFSQKILR